MELTEINRLLDKYWEGETTLEEEAQLRRYFQEEEPPAALRPVAELFRHYENPPQLDEDFDQQLLSRIVEQKPVSMWPTLLKIAAVVTLFLVGTLWFKQTYWTSPEPTIAVATQEDTYEDPERAYEETKQALLLMSSLMNEGTEHLTKLEKFNEAQQSVKEENVSSKL